MNNKMLLFGVGIGVVIIVIATSYVIFQKGIFSNPPPGGDMACTQETMLCPDGSYVGRTGPNCAFAACPGATNTTSSTSSTPAPTPGNGVINGTISLSPTCPVERIPPDPACAPRAYQTLIAVSKNIETPTPLMTIQSSASGTFSVSLPAGEYLFYAPASSAYPRCNEQLVAIAAGDAKNVAISCDTGIR